MKRKDSRKQGGVYGPLTRPLGRARPASVNSEETAKCFFRVGNTGDRRDLEQQRKRAWRRCEAYAAGTDPDAPPTPAPLVRGGDAA